MSTLANTERRLAPVVHLVGCLCSTGGVLLLMASCGALLARPVPAAWNLWGLCLLVWAALTASNLVYVRQHGRPTVGMIPVSLCSLAPAAASVLATPDAGGRAQWVALVVLVPSAALCVLFASGFCRLRAAYAPAPVVGPDAIVIVLGGAVRKGVPCRTLAQRLDVALRIWEEGPQRTLVLTGGPLPHERGTEAAAMASYLEERGVSPASLVLEQKALNTRENVVRSLALVRERGLRGQLCVLTSDYHLYRAVREGRRLGAELVPIAAPTPRASRLQQWSREVLTLLAAAMTA